VRTILGATALLAATLSIPFVVSFATYRLIEQPMVARGRLVCNWLNCAVARRPALQPGAGPH